MREKVNKALSIAGFCAAIGGLGVMHYNERIYVQDKDKGKTYIEAPSQEQRRYAIYGGALSLAGIGMIVLSRKDMLFARPERRKE